jgi:hypothetical protein
MEAVIPQVPFTESYEVRLALLTYIDENVYVIYAPALDLYGYGNDEHEARSSFETTLNEYLDFTTAGNTLLDDLLRLGWTLNSQSDRVMMPSWGHLLELNPHLNEVMNNRPFKKFDQPTRLPVFA